MNTVIKIYEKETLDIGIRLALATRMYINGWCLKPSLESQLGHVSDSRLAMMLTSWPDSDIPQMPIALAWICNAQVMAFCRESYRRKGFASQCVQALEFDRNLIKADLGIDGSEIFWERCGVQRLPEEWFW